MEQKIYKKIIEAMGKITAISKGRKNTQGNFLYRGVDDVMNDLHGVLAEVGIFIVPEVLSEERTQATAKSGGNLYFTRLLTNFHFFADDGSSVKATVIGEAMDSSDKASNKALSVGFKYACFQVFCIPTEEEKDPDANSYQTNPQPKPTPKPVDNSVLDGKIYELRSLLDLASPESRPHIQRAIEQRNEKAIDDFLAKAKEKKATLEKEQNGLF